MPEWASRMEQVTGSVVTTGAAGAHHDHPGRSGEFNSIIRSIYERYIITLA